jgi:transposase
MSASEDQRNLVATLEAAGLSRREIARRLGISRNTVRRILNSLARQRERGTSALPSPPVHRESKLDEHEAFIKEQLEEFPTLTAVRLYEELLGKGFDGGYTIVKDHLRKVRPQPKQQPVERFETEPGEQGQQDWSPYDIPFTRAGLRRMHAFSLVLGYSRRQHLHFGDDERHHAMIRQHRAAFERFGGVPKEILYDQQKVVVLSWEAGRPIYNPRFLSFATHYGFRPVALPPRRPDLKGKVERPFDYIEKNLLNGRQFRDPDHLNEVTEWWLGQRADLRTHGTLKQRPIDRFVTEAPALLPLPARPYDTAEVGYRLVSIEGRVSWDVTPYSVPSEHVLEVVCLRVTETEVFIYDSAIRLIARHEKAPAGQREPVVSPEHRPKKRQRVDTDQLVERLGALGEEAALFAAGVCQKQRYRSHHLSKVLALVERYSADDLVRALERAVRYRAYDAAVVSHILEASASPRLLPETRLEAARQRLAAMLPAGSPRSLDLYNDALCGGLDPTEEEEE